MGNASLSWRRFLAHTLGSVAIPLVLPLGGQAQPQQPPGATEAALVRGPQQPAVQNRAEELPVSPKPVSTTARVPGAALTLSDCVGIAMGQQPALAAHRASLAAAEAESAGWTS